MMSTHDYIKTEANRQGATDGPMPISLQLEYYVLMESNKTPRVWATALVIALVILIWFLLPQLSVVFFTALMAFTFYPLYMRLKRKSGTVAAGVTLLISFMVFLVPLAFITFAAISQLAAFAESASQSQYWEQTPAFAQSAIDFTNNVLAPITGEQINLTDTNIVEFLRTAIPTIARTLAGLLFSVIGSLPQLGVAIIVYIFLFLECLRYGPSIIEAIVKISPFERRVTKQYFEKIGLMANAMMRGQLIISMIISAFAALLLSFIGYGHYFFILFIVITILNFIPLGGGILLIPLAAYSMFTGQFWPGLIVIVLYYLFGNIEPILRARLIPDKIQLSVGLTMLATFCGIAYFGILGVVYGPIIMIIILTTFEFYTDLKSKRSAELANK